MPRNNKTCLIISQSGRALAASARAGGIAAHVLDRFGDLDTVSAALSCQAVSGDESGFHVGELLEKLTPFLRTPLYGVVYGSGLEEHYDVLEFLHRHWTLLGNEAAVVKACTEPALFFPALTRLGIPHPHTSLTIPQRPSKHENWLIKRTGASGGGHVRALGTDTQAGPHYYFQTKLTGRSLSVVFLADTLNATIVGINEMWTVAPEKYDFRYSGAVTQPDLHGSTARTLEDIVRVLVRELGLKGLCGMDVLIDENGQCHVLEINPRPTATFELHQTQQSLCGAHVLACQGKLPTLPPGPPFLRAHQVWYADRDFIVPDFVWPDWVSDRPRSGRYIRSGAPVCVVHAEAMCMNDVRTLLNNRFATIMELMGLQQLAA
jgi:predicted ATP-grasp superfamily ATP-dependent carboligase